MSLLFSFCCFEIFLPLFLLLPRETILITLQPFYENTPHTPFATCTQQLLSKQHQMRAETALLPSPPPFTAGCVTLTPTAASCHFPFQLQVRPSSLATIPIRQSHHLSGCQLIIMILMIFQLGSALDPIRGIADSPNPGHHKEA